MQGGTRKPIIAAESNPEGAPAGGISALEYGIVQSLTSIFPPKRNDTWVVPYNIAIVPHTSNKREAALCKNALPPKPTKNFPQEHPPKTKRTKSSHCIGGCSWGKFWEGQGGLEGRKPSTKEGFLRLQGLPLLLPELQRRFSGGLLEALEKIRTALVPALPDDLVHGNFFPQ